MKNLRLLLLPVLITTLLVSGAFAQTGNTMANHNVAFGLRAGYTGWNSLSQIHLGAHLKMAEVFPNIRYTPNIEAGFGDNVTLITFNNDLAYNFTELVARPWNFYGGGSLSFNYFNHDLADSETDIGLSVLMGLDYALDSGNEAMVEIRLGIMDSPDFKLTLGYTFF